jgi:dihydroxyacid dehydratase/phosphogluconate dehydratase
VAVVKPAAASPRLLSHRGPAVVFDSVEDLHARLDGPDLDVTADSVLVLRGPRAVPACRRCPTCRCRRNSSSRGYARHGAVCDGRMSGTAYGTVVLHVVPEAAAGGPLAKVRTGDIIVLDVARRRLDADVSAAEWAAREPSPEAAKAYAALSRGWERLYVDTVGQADTGAGCDLLRCAGCDEVSRESH